MYAVTKTDRHTCCVCVCEDERWVHYPVLSRGAGRPHKLQPNEEACVTSVRTLTDVPTTTFFLFVSDESVYIAFFRLEPRVSWFVRAPQTFSCSERG